MCTENVKEKTELLYALINGRKLSDLPKISQVMIYMTGSDVNRSILDPQAKMLVCLTIEEYNCCILC